MEERCTSCCPTSQILNGLVGCMSHVLHMIVDNGGGMGWLRTLWHSLNLHICGVISSILELMADVQHTHSHTHINKYSGYMRSCYVFFCSPFKPQALLLLCNHFYIRSLAKRKKGPEEYAEHPPRFLGWSLCCGWIWNGSPKWA